MSVFGQLVSQHDNLAEELPLVHTSRAEFLNAFVSAQAIAPRLCPVFQENLIYLFYGRPAYRSAKGGLAGDEIALCPICFVFKPNTVSRKAVRVFPCDTGAVRGNRFQPHLTSNDLPELELDPRIESARKLVPMLFKTNKSYFFGRAISASRFSDGSPPFRFQQLLLAKGPAGFDDRKSAIEIQVRESVSLRDQLSFVVLPMEFLDDLAIRKAILEDWNCDPEPYDTTQGAAPAEYYAIVRRAIEQRFKQSTRI